MSRPLLVECFVCRKHRGEISVPGGVVYENDLIYISHAQLWGDERDHYLGHLFVEPKRHVPELANLTEEEAQAIGLYTSRAARAWSQCSAYGWHHDSAGPGWVES